MKKRSRAAIAVLALLGLVIPQPAAASAEMQLELVAGEGNWVPYTGLSEDTRDAAHRIDELARQYPDMLTGVAITGKDSIEVSIASGSKVTNGVALVKQQLKAHKGKVKFVRVKHSRRSMDRVKQEILDRLTSRRYEGLVTGVGENPSRGVALVYITAGAEQAQAELTAEFGDAIEFLHEGNSGLVGEPDRVRDQAPHYGGALYTRWNENHSTPSGSCSTSFPVERNGNRYMLTAGHCLPGSIGAQNYLWAAAFTDEDSKPPAQYYFGGAYTTTMNGTPSALIDGTQDLWGDWALIQGSTYSPQVYSCPNYSGYCSSLYVGAVDWGVPSYHEEVCWSGGRTQQRCRNFVHDTDTTWVYQGITYKRLSTVMSDQNLDGVYECGDAYIVDNGDSGGAVYQGISGRPGYVRAMGIVQSRDPVGCRSRYTRLQGVKAFSSAFTMPTF